MCYYLIFLKNYILFVERRRPRSSWKDFIIQFRSIGIQWTFFIFSYFIFNFPWVIFYYNILLHFLSLLSYTYCFTNSASLIYINKIQLQLSTCPDNIPPNISIYFNYTKTMFPNTIEHVVWSQLQLPIQCSRSLVRHASCPIGIKGELPRQLKWHSMAPDQVSADHHIIHIYHVQPIGYSSQPSAAGRIEQGPGQRGRGHRTDIQ